jgi:hypothetical protein
MERTVLRMVPRRAVLRERAVVSLRPGCPVYPAHRQHTVAWAHVVVERLTVLLPDCPVLRAYP